MTATSTPPPTPPTSTATSAPGRLLRSGAVALRGPLPATMGGVDRLLQNLATTTRAALDEIAGSDRTVREKRDATARVIASARVQFTAAAGGLDRVHELVAGKARAIADAIAAVEAQHSGPLAVARLQARAATLAAMDATARAAAFDSAAKLGDTAELLAHSLDKRGPATTRALARAAHPQLFAEIGTDVVAYAALRAAAMATDRGITALGRDPDACERDRGASATDMLSVAHDGAAAVGIVPAQQVAPHWWALAGTD